MAMVCPKCESETLAEFKVETVRVDRCSSCNGIWFDALELSQLLSEDAKQVTSLTQGGSRSPLDGKRGRCPHDGSELLRIFSAVDRSVIVDACADCHGIWLDGGEFEKLFGATAARR